MSAESNKIWIRTFAYDTGELRDRGSALLPIELIDSLPHSYNVVEGSLEFRIGGVWILSNESLPCGYIEDWWRSSFDAVENLLSLRSTCWMLPGKVCHVRIDVRDGTRRAWVQAVLQDNEPLAPGVEAHVPSLVESMLDEAERFYRWLSAADADVSVPERIGELRSRPAPWRQR